MKVNENYNWKTSSLLGVNFWDKKNDYVEELDLENVKNEYGQEFLELQSIIMKHDPDKCHYLPYEFCDYSLVTLYIIVQLEELKTLIEVHALVHREFVRIEGGLDEDDDYFKKFEPLAKDILDWKLNPDRDLFHEYFHAANIETRKTMNLSSIEMYNLHNPWILFKISKLLRPDNKYIKKMDELFFEVAKVWEYEGSASDALALELINEELSEFESTHPQIGTSDK